MANGRPYGGDFLVQTPALDRLGQNLYMEQKLREQRQLQEGQQLDNEFRKNVSNMRDADIPDYVQKYQDWKNSRKQLIGMNPNSPDFVQKQLETQRKLADTYQFGAASQERKKEEEQFGSSMLSKPDSYKDNAYSLLRLSRNTPLSSLGNVTDANNQKYDLSDLGQLMDNGINFDFSGLSVKSKGTPRQISTIEEPQEGGLQTKYTPVYYGNSPTQYKDVMLGGLYTNKGGKFAANMWDNIPQATKDAVNQKFQSLPPEQLKQIGLDNPADLEPKIPESKAEQFASYMAKLYAINEKPELRTPTFKTNEEEKMNREFANQAKLQVARNNFQAWLHGQPTYKEMNGTDEEKTNTWIDGFVKNVKDQAIAGNDLRAVNVNGKTIQGYRVPMNDVMAKSLGFNDKTKGELIVDKDGNWYKLPYQPDEAQSKENISQNRFLVDKTAITKESDESIKAALGKKIAGTKQTNIEMQTKPNNKKGKYDNL